MTAGFPRRLTERVWLLGNPCVSIYLLLGDDSALLLEAGISLTAGQAVDQLGRIGVSPARVESLIITHGHNDHCGGAPHLKAALPNLRVLTGRPTAELLAREKIQQAFLKDDADESARLIGLGHAAGPIPEPVSVAGVVDGLIEPGQALDLGGLSLNILDAPGHAVGNLAFWEESERMIFCSDSLGFYLPTVDKFTANFYVNLDEYLDTFDRLAGLRPEWVCPGHSYAHQGQAAREFIRRSRAEIEAVRDLVETADDAGRAEADLVEEILRRHYQGEAKLFSPEMMQLCSELLVRRVRESKKYPHRPARTADGRS